MAKELVKVEEYAIIKNEAQLREVIEQNIGNSGLSSFDLDRIKIPSGGGNTWTVPSIEGDTQEKEITGIIIHWKEMRRYWKTKIEEDGTQPPSCYSDGGVHGFGEPGGVCSECPFSKFEKDSGQACQLRRTLFMMRSTDLIPILIDLPVTSVKPIKKYFLRLTTVGLSFWSVETTLTLKGAENKKKIKYSVVEAQMKQRVSPGAMEKVKALISELKPSLDKSRVKDEDKNPQ